MKTILVCEGRPAEAIVKTARCLQADTIVMGMRRHRRWLPWLHRNTALQVARLAPCRTWLVCPGKDAGSVPALVLDHAFRLVLTPGPVTMFRISWFQ